MDTTTMPAPLTIRVPATIANMGPGFDSFGMAVSLYNRFIFHPADADSLSFAPESTVKPTDMAGDGHDNVLFVAMDRLYAVIGRQRDERFRVAVAADIPVARGLGSSSTAVVAGLVAANRLAGEPLERHALLDLAIAMEGHPDNVVPTLTGGVVLCDMDPPGFYMLPWPLEWRVMVLSPPYPLRTEHARRILPDSLPMADAVFNLRKASLLTYALLREDSNALRAALHDRLHQPYRRTLIAEYDAIEQLALDAGAFGMVLSGSGSSMAIFYPTVIHATLLEKLEAYNARLAASSSAMRINDLAVDPNGTQLLSPVQPAI